MAKQLRVPGHMLRDSGRIWVGWPLLRYSYGPGYGVCSCGERSPDLPSTAARQRWHRQHKEALLAEQEDAP